MDEQTETADQLISRLYEGYNLDSPAQFLEKISKGDYEIYKLTKSCYALARWNSGYFEVLTCAGNVEESERAMLAIEKIARDGGAHGVIGLARYGWKSLLEKLGYDAGTKLCFFRKELNYDSLS
jgi:hypothetical protein